MAAKDKAGAAASAARNARGNPYVQRIVQDEELRDNVVVAYEAARDAYARLTKGKAPTKRLMEDKKLHKDLKRSADALREATMALREAPKRSKPKPKRKGGLGRLLIVALIGGAVAVAVNEGLRSKLLDALFGAEEEFDYTSNTAPAAPPSDTAPVA
ncbi:MAG TPA: hypothetical protein VM299_01985 [Solirubrobacteraceae bacterium]|jgi:hypothetical protein|nr:hypothetical protein [Solirubrobacteraceae bacterium]